MNKGVEGLPPTFPIFPLSGCLLLPGGNLPLNIFEPRYLKMVRDAMQTERVIGMIQPKGGEDMQGRPVLFDTGCAGRIDNFKETDDGRCLITLTGVCRFDIENELDTTTPYRKVAADFSGWLNDFSPEPPPDDLRSGLLRELMIYFETQGIEVEWDALEAAPMPGLITSLAMICPFHSNEKQALLQARTLTEQAKLLETLLQMANLESMNPSQRMN